MNIEDFVRKNYQTNPSSTVRVSKILRAWRAAGNVVTRSAFLCGLGAAGLTVALDSSNLAVVVGLSNLPARVLTVRDGRVQREPVAA
jgi:hypothetical protein